MNKLNYFLLLFLSLFVITSVVVKPKSYENYFKLDVDATIPEERLNGDIQERSASYIPYYMKFGSLFFDVLIKNLDPLEKDYIILKGF